MAVTVLKNIKESKKGKASQHLCNAIKYIMNPDKTEDNLWIGSNCGTNADEIYQSMIITKKDYQKEWGRQGYHFVISFPPGEADEATCYSVGKEFCEQYLGNNYDYCFAVHNDHDHMHCHIVFNSVDRMSGNKYRYVNGDWEKSIQPVTDELCRKYGLKELVYDKDKRRIGKSYAEHAAVKNNKFTWKSIIRLDIDRAVSISNTMEEYKSEMERMGYDIRIGKSEKYGTYIAYNHPAIKEVRGHKSERARRDYRLGIGYKYIDIEQRISDPNKTIIPADKIYVMEKLHSFSEQRQTSRFQVCALLRYQHAAQYHFFNMQIKDQIQVREDLLHIDKIRDECNYLLDNQIDNLEAAEDKLEILQDRIRLAKEKQRDQTAASELFSDEEIMIQNEYNQLKVRLEENDLSDQEFEKIADRLEEYESKYYGLLDMYVKQDNTGIQTLLQERLILKRIIKEAEVIQQTEELPVIEEDRNKDLENKPQIRR